MQDMHGIIKTSYEKWGKVMYAQLKLELEADDIDYKKSSNLQGILMENIDTEYAGIRMAIS